MKPAANRPRTKRQFKPVDQPSILSYFHASSSALDTNNTAPPFLLSQIQTHTSFASHLPALPAPVQASLLNVGMRVRKSVPEGYKTGKDSDLQLAIDMATSSPNVKSVRPPGPQRKRSDAISISKGDSPWTPDAGRYSPDPGRAALTRANISATALAELAPFCGIHKVGGYAAQPSFGLSLSSPHARSNSAAAALDYTNSDDDDDDELSLPSSSQLSLMSRCTDLTTASTISSSTSSADFTMALAQQQPRISRKRSHDGLEDEDEEHSWVPPFHSSAPAALPSSSHGYTLAAHAPLPDFDARMRAIAMPTSRRKDLGDQCRRSEDAACWMEMRSSGGGGGLRDVDFGEAKFLEPLAGDGMDVDMGGY